jgi:antitoxin component YwqK of YwqJK toxin-antitoxin module
MTVLANWELANQFGDPPESPAHDPLTHKLSKEGVPRMRRSFLRRWLRITPTAVTVVALSFGLTAHAEEQDSEQAPKKLPIALLSNDGSEESIHVSTEPGVMGEVELVRERYNDGAIHIERQTTLDRDGNYVNHGSWKMFSPNGNVLAEGQYHFGRRVGLWTRWHNANDSKLFSEMPFKEFKAPFMSQVNFTDGVMDGEWIITDANDRKVCQISLKDGQRNGLAITWLPSGSTYRQGTYENGLPVGDLLQVNKKTGKVERTATYSEGRKVVSKTEYYPGEKQKKSEALYLSPVATQQSADDFWSARLAKFATEGKNLRHGLAKAWFPNGKLESEGTYQFGKKSGTFTFWHENGQVLATGEYRDDLAEGQWVWWHQNGQRSAFGRYENGQLIGEWRWWNEGGKLTKQHVYDGTESAATEQPEEAIDISSRATGETVK